MTSEAFNLIYDGLTEARAAFRVSGRTLVSRVICGNVDWAREGTELGQVRRVKSTDAMFLRANEPTKGTGLGDRVEVKASGASEWTTLRVADRTETGEVVKLRLESEYE